MMFMTWSVGTGGARRPSGQAVAVAALAFVLVVVVLPVCSAAFLCAMPCCQDAGAGSHDHDAMPAAVCGGAGMCSPAARSDEASLSASVGMLLGVVGLAVQKHCDDHRVAANPRSCSPARTSSRRLHVVNDVFLI